MSDAGLARKQQCCRSAIIISTALPNPRRQVVLRFANSVRGSWLGDAVTVCVCPGVEAKRMSGMSREGKEALF